MGRVMFPSRYYLSFVDHPWPNLRSYRVIPGVSRSPLFRQGAAMPLPKIGGHVLGFSGGCIRVKKHICLASGRAT